MKLRDSIKKKILIVISIIVGIITIVFLFKLYNYIRVKTAIKKVEFVDKLETEVYSDVKVRDFIKSINGKIIDNYKIDTTKIGKKEIEFLYINDDNIKVPYTFNIKIVDNTPPLVGHDKYHTVYKGFKGDIAKDMFCGDNYDDKPKCKIEGEYDLNTIGEYPVTFTAIDSSNNKTSHNITVKVKEKITTNYDDNDNFTWPDDIIKFSDIKKKYKTKNTKIGIDISRWQGDINYKKLKKAGVEFVFIRIGYQKDNGKYELDSKFKKNIENLNKQKIPVGVYFYSKANSKEEAIKQARWITKKIKKYDVDLPIAFDWEDFDSYQDYKISFYHLSEVAETFMNTIEKNNYDTLLYSNKYDLENIWMKTNHKIWLAHYIDKTNYEGKYKVWQLCENGKVNGINHTVDIDIMY